MEVAFGNPEGAAAVTPLPEQPANTITSGGTVYASASDVPVHPTQDTGVSVPTVRPPHALAPGGLVLGDRLPDFDEIILPRINLVQGIGELKDTFPQGAIVFGQQSILFEPNVIDKQTGNIKVKGTPPIVITVLGFRPTRFVEKVEGGVRGAIYNTEAEVRANGGTLDYKEWQLKKAAGMKRFEQLADAVVVIRRPDHLADDDTVFIYPVADAKYALGLWSMKGTAYTAAAKSVFFTARAIGCLSKGGYPSYAYNVSTRNKPFDNGNACWVPVCVPNSKNTPEFIEFAARILNPQPAAAE